MPEKQVQASKAVALNKLTEFQNRFSRFKNWIEKQGRLICNLPILLYQI